MEIDFRKPKIQLKKLHSQKLNNESALLTSYLIFLVWLYKKTLLAEYPLECIA
jgi:hypothetical protein